MGDVTNNVMFRIVHLMALIVLINFALTIAIYLTKPMVCVIKAVTMRHAAETDRTVQLKNAQNIVFSIN